MKEQCQILFVGDFYALNPTKIHLDDSVKTIINQSDLAVCNFEGPVNYLQSNATVKSGPAIAQSRESVEFLKNSGFNIFTLGNNHSMDFGEVCLRNTVVLFDINEILGVGDYQNAYRLLIKNINGLKIGFLSASHYEFGMTDSLNRQYGIAWINDPQIDRAIETNRDDVDYLFVLPHAGVENIDIPLPEWRLRYRHFIDIGADAVIASHPHVPQGMEIYNNKPILYSLGNFFFESMDDEDRRHNIAGYFTIRLMKDNQIDFTLGFLKRDGYNIQALDLEESQKEWYKLNSLISDENKYLKLIDNVSKRLWANCYKKSFYYGFRKPSLRYGILFNIKMLVKSILKRDDTPLLLNNLRCESHRWVIQRAMQNYIKHHDYQHNKNN